MLASRTAGLLAGCVSFAVLSACSHPSIPEAGSKRYRDFVSAFYVGLAGLQTGEDNRARQFLTKASELVPGEPAPSYDLALLSARQQNFDAAADYANRALSADPADTRVEQLLGAIEAKRGNVGASIAHLRRAVELGPRNLKAAYALAEQLEREGTPAGNAEAQLRLTQVLGLDPGNIAAELELVRVAIERADVETARRMLAALTGPSADWPDEARARLAALANALRSPNPRPAAVQAVFLRNVLLRVPAYRRSADILRVPASFVGEPLTRFVKVSQPRASVAPADSSLTFSVTELPVPSKQVGASGEEKPAWVGALALDASGKYTPVIAGRGMIAVGDAPTLRLPGQTKAGALTRASLTAADLNYDFKTDLIAATAQGLKLYQQQSPRNFVDITVNSKIPPGVANASYTGAWPFDIDLDGDLDVVLASDKGEPAVLRNNGDNTFAVVHPFKGIDGVIAFAASDLDGDGDPDVAMIDGVGSVHVFMNQRLGQFRERQVPANWQRGFIAIAAGDVNGDGVPDLIALRDNGSVERLSSDPIGGGWDAAEIAASQGAGPVRPNLLLADFDNNGALDIFSGNGRVFLGTGTGFVEVKGPADLDATTAVDLNGDGHVSIVGIQRNRPVAALSNSAKQYRWQTLEFRAANAHGDQRINSFGIGGEVEIRAGLLTEKQVITAPALHFGLGDQTEVDVARIVWPNGSVQAEFDLKSNQTILAQQRLKGSCPWLFAWNGREVRFVKDGAPWSPALGLHINAQTVAGITQTEEWFKIPGQQLAPRDGEYDLRLTDELWEVYYVDRYALIAVDHPRDTEIYTDERFSNPGPALKVYTVSPVRSFASATDDCGANVADVVRENDGRYLDTFGRGRYQGVTRDHWVEVQLPEDAPRTGKLYLIGSGWLHPTDATVNVALGQNSDPPPKSLSLEVPDSNGRWHVARSNLGFLAGKMKTAVLDISEVFVPGAPRRLRLRTNLEVYWDRLGWATAASEAQNQVQKLPLICANLRPRGFSEVHAANASSPEIPDYNLVENTGVKWRDIEGYYTRYGDIRPLLADVDDRIVIVGAGDEMQLRFAAPPPPKAGFIRDFVIVSNGWIKDGDYNSTFSKTVLPIPHRGMKTYTNAPGELESDPAYRMHPADWKLFHTRYVTPQPFIQALRN